MRAGKVWPIPVDRKTVTEPSNVRPTGLQTAIPILHNNHLMCFEGVHAWMDRLPPRLPHVIPLLQDTTSLGAPFSISVVLAHNANSEWQKIHSVSFSSFTCSNFPLIGFHC